MDRHRWYLWRVLVPLLLLLAGQPLIVPAKESGDAAPAADSSRRVVVLLAAQGTATYVSPTFGYTLAWDAAWTEVGRASAGGLDSLVLSNGTSDVAFTGSTDHGADARSCRESAAQAIGAQAGTRDFVPATVDDLPQMGGDAINAWGLYRYTAAAQTRVAYLECRAMPSQDATVLIALFTAADIYQAQAPLVSALLNNVLVPVLADNFDDPERGVIATGSSDSAEARFTYEEGEFVIQKLNEDGQRAIAMLPGTYDDLVIAVDARLVGETNARYIIVGCRADGGVGGYELLVLPARQAHWLFLWEDGPPTTLSHGYGEQFIKPDHETNRLELSCVGSTISARVNGVEVANEQNAVHARGNGHLVVASLEEGVPGVAEARFDNFIIAAPPSGGLATPSPPSD